MAARQRRPRRPLRLDPKSFAFTMLLGMLSALPPLATDMSLPALGEIAQSLHSTPGTAALTLSLFVIGFALGPIAYGLLSDRYGRRPVMLFGCALPAAAATEAALAALMPMLLFWRVVQGLSAGAGAIVSYAVARDLFEGAALRRRLSQVSMARVVSPMVAPSLGALVLPFGGWRGIYALTATAGGVLFAVVAFGFRETAPRHSGKPVVPLRLLASYARVFGNRLCVGYSVVNACAFGSLFAYISGSSLVMMQLLGVPPRVFGGLFALIDLGLMGGFFVNARFGVRGVAPVWPLTSGLVLGTSASLALMVLSLADLAEVASLVPLLILGAFGYGLITPNAALGALRPLPEAAGVA
ncbi:MAG: multidrug effflux MFS transporter [Rhodospirillales bacterium]|nr:multidrug effflux MFS transporter [Rhodospirillales bacterium]